LRYALNVFRRGTTMTTARPTSDRLPLRLFHALAAGLLAAVLALPGGGARAADEADPPGRVGRLADLQGQAWTFATESGEWLAAERNAVLTSGDRIATDAGGRVELRVGSTTVYLDGASELEMARLDDERIDLRLYSGSAALRIRNPEKLREIAVLTGEGRFTFQRTGRYRVDRFDEASHLTVYSGEGLYEGPRSALAVHAGQHAEFWIDGAGVAQYRTPEPVRDAFAAWAGERDRASDRSASTQYVSPEMTGVEELDRYGRWQQTAEYGALWVPYGVAPGWVPYSTGRWAWVRPWGWTWVDEAPWGFAPFHYGRWVYFGGSWCWAPGYRVMRPVFAPALVAWVGGPNFSLSLNFGGGPAVGWFPLAPREVYVPGYRHSPRYVREVNVTHVTNVTIINNAVRQPPNPYDLRNRKFPNAVTVVPATVVRNRQPVAGPAAQLRDTPVARQLVVRNDAAGGNAFVPPVAPPARPARGSFDASTVRPPVRTQTGPGVPAGRAQTPRAEPAERTAPPRAEPADRDTRDDRDARPPRNGGPERSAGETRDERPARPAPVPAPSTTTPAGPTRPAARPAPEPRPGGQSQVPAETRPAAPQPRPAAPQTRPPAPQTRPAAPVAQPVQRPAAQPPQGSAQTGVTRPAPAPTPQPPGVEPARPPAAKPADTPAAEPHKPQQPRNLREARVAHDERRDDRRMR
jgi:hypothetical protein